MRFIVIDPFCSGSFSYKFKLEDGAEVKPQVPLLNNRVYDTKFESQFYMISDANKVLLSFVPLHNLICGLLLQRFGSCKCTLFFGISYSFYLSDRSVYMQWVTLIQVLQNCPRVNTIYGYI